MERREALERGFGLGWGLGASLALHAVLAVLLWLLLPLAGIGQSISRPDSPRLVFTFARATDSGGDGLPGKLPSTPTPPTSIPNARPSTAPTVAPSSVAPTPTWPEAGNPAPTHVQPAAVDATDAERSPESTSAPRRLDVSRALREFGDALTQRPALSKGSGDGPQNVFVPDLSAFPRTGFGMGNLQFESTDYDWSDYGRQIYVAIWRAWHRRLYATTNEFEKWAHENAEWMLQHQSQVAFVIERNGQVTGITLELRAGCPPLDKSAADALAEVILPPLPSGFPRDREVVHARFLTQGEVRGLLPNLRYLKSMGYF